MQLRARSESGLSEARIQPRHGAARLVRRRLFGLGDVEATFARRGFPGAGRPAQARLERIGVTFLDGYRAALDDTDPQALIPALQQVPVELRGFAYEGAAMALGLLDLLTPWNRSRFNCYLEHASPHVYMLHVGLGWAWARLRARVGRRLAAAHPDYGWLAVDGYGFHEGYFHWPRYIERREPPRLRGYAARAFDQGLGRSLWFVEGADAERVAARVQGFAPPRRPDLWSGVGLACAYAGGAEVAGVEALREAAGSSAPQLAQGVVFAAAARHRAGTPAAHTDQVAEAVCRLTSAELARLADETYAALGPGGDDVPRYETWRRSIQRRFAS